MTEFKQVAGQLEGLWNESMAEATARGRKAGAAAAVETVWQAAEKLAEGWEGSATPPQYGVANLRAFVQELRRRVGGEPGLLSPEEWDRVHAALEPLEAVGRGTELMTAEEWERRRLENLSAQPPYLATFEEVERARQLDEARLQAEKEEMAAREADADREAQQLAEAQDLARKAEEGPDRKHRRRG